MLTGVGALAIAFYVAHLSNLRTLDWLVGTILPYSIFALIVIFQTEIRQALARLGRNLTLTRGSQNGTADAYDDIVMAATTFSQDQTGALVVIEREIGLRTYIESGVALDAHLSYDLLATLFRPSAPLHDGAVILQKDRVAAAACFLPLSMNPLLSTQLGTRHRAGIGITEETDAVSVIVSEETGAISIAVGGQVERDITPERLRQRLGELLMRYSGQPTHSHPGPHFAPSSVEASPQPGRGRPHGSFERASRRRPGRPVVITRLRHLIFDHALLKLTSLIIAILMWYGVAHDPVAEVSLRVPIEFSRPPKGLDYTSDVIPQAQLRLRGPARVLRDLPVESVHAVDRPAGCDPWRTHL